MRHGALAAYATTATLTRAGVEASGPGVLVATIALGGSLTGAALLVASLTAAAALAGPVVGTLLDHSHRPGRGISAAVGLFAACLLLIAALLLRFPPLAAVPVALVAGLGQPAATGAWTAQLPWVVPGHRLPRAYAVDAGTYNVATLVGPAVATSALVLAPEAPVLVAVVLLVLGLLTLPLVPLGTRDHLAGARPTWSDVVDGVRGLFGTRALRYSSTVTTVGFAGQAALLVAAPVVSQRLTGGLAFTGWLLAGVAAGGLVGSIVLARRPLPSPDGALAVAQVVIAVGLVVVGVAGAVSVALAGAVVLGLGDAVLITSMFQVRSRDSAPSMLARVFTTGASLRTGAYALATALFGLAIGAGAGAVLLVGAAVQIAALAAGRLAAGPAPSPA